MPERKTIERARRDKRRGLSAGSQAGEFVREEIHHVREGRHGARSARQAIAIGLSKARRAGVKVPVPKKGEASAATRRKARQDNAAGRHPHAAAPKRARAVRKALQREPNSAASKSALGRQASAAARRRSAADRSASARKAARTKGPRRRVLAARKAARTRRRRRA
jgi:hypothetical protein